MTAFNIDYTTPSEYTYDSNKIQIANGKASLKLVEDDPHICSETFDSDVGFVYDNTKAEFVGGQVQQKDLQPIDSIVWATYTTSVNLNYAPSGSLTPTLIGTPSIVSNRLDCTGGGNTGLYYENSNIANVVTQGAIKFKFTPDYSGTPTLNTNLIEISEGIINRNKIVIFHGTVGGNLRISLWNNLNGSELSAYQIATWNPIVGTTYEFELNWDTTIGVFRLLLNGVVQGSIPTTIYTRTNTADRIYVGAGTVYPISDGYYEDVILFNTVQHTSNYTPSYILPEAKYEGSVVEIPATEGTGPGFFIEIESFTSIESGTPRYIAQPNAVGDYYYWNGSAWVISDQTYAQANDITTFSANIGTLDVYGYTKCRVAIIFQNENTISYVSQLDALIIEQVYPTDSPIIYKTSGDQKDVLNWYSFIETLGSGNEGNIYYQLSLDSLIWKFWNGSTFANAINPTDYNTASELSTNIKYFTGNQLITLYVKAFLVSNGNQAVELDNLLISYVNRFDCQIFAEIQNLCLKFKRKNSCSIKLLLKDDEDNIITDLSLANTIKFMIKKESTDSNNDAIISKDLTNGIIVDNPTTGYLRINLDADDLDIEVRDYYIGLQIIWENIIKEATFKFNTYKVNYLSITQDIIR